MSETLNHDPTSSSLENVSRVDLNPMNNLNHGFRISSEGKDHGGVFVSKEQAGELAQSYYHANELRDAMAAQGLSAEQVNAVFASAADKARIHIDEMPEGRSKYGNDRVISVYDSEQNKIGGGAEFHGKTEASHSAGEYLDVDLSSIVNLEGAILELQTPLAPVEASQKMAATIEQQGNTEAPLGANEVSEGRAERESSKRALFRKLTAAALIGASLIGPGLKADTGPAHHESSPPVAAAAPDLVSEAPQTYQAPDVAPQDLHRDTYSVEVAPNAADWMIHPGDGGDVLFEHIGVDESKWNQIAPQLYDQYKDTGYFYKTQTGDVRFSKPGEVPENVQHTIESLVAHAK